MTRLYEPDIEERLFHLSEVMANLRHDLATARIDKDFFDARIDVLQAEYSRLKNSSEELTDWTDPATLSRDYVEPEEVTHD